MLLLAHHKQMLEDVGIDPEIITSRGYESMQKLDRPRLEELGFSALALARERFPGLLIPAWSLVTGEVWGFQYRPDRPRTDRRGRVVKYENPRYQEMRLDVAPLAQEMLEDPEMPLVVTEGAKKADCVLSDEHGFIPINLLGVGIWRTAGCIEEWEAIQLHGYRTCYIAFDSDAVTKWEVQQQEMKLGLWLSYFMKTPARLMRIPAGPKGEKWGLDDYLAAGFSMDHLVRSSYSLED